VTSFSVTHVDTRSILTVACKGRFSASGPTNIPSVFLQPHSAGSSRPLLMHYDRISAPLTHILLWRTAFCQTMVRV
jgi:hypothetical protein